MRRVTLCVVGLGFGRHIIENELLEGPASPFFDLTAVCDRDVNKADSIAKEKGLKAYYSLEETLKDSSLEVIGLFTGPVGRAGLIEKIIDAGKDVMTTKPFETDSAEALRILKKAEKLGRMVHLNSPNIAPSLDKKIISGFRDTYSLGKLCAGRWEGWYKAVEQADGTWYDNPQLCPAAPILRLGIYGINELVPLFGKPTGVEVMQSRMLTGRPTADLAQMMVQFESGAMISLLGGWCMAPDRCCNRIHLHFENGTIVKDIDWRSPVHGLHSKLRIQLFTPEKGFSDPVEERIIDSSDSSSAYQWDRFYEAVTERRVFEDGTSPEQIADSIRVLEMMSEAALRNQL